MIRVCPERDAACPHGMSCPYVGDRYTCREGWRDVPAEPPRPGLREREDIVHHNRHPWLQPGDRPHRAWILRFDDNDVRDMVWTHEDAEKDALAAYALYSPSWNCYLFATVAAPVTEPQARATADAERLEANALVKDLLSYASEAIQAAGCGFRGWSEVERRALAFLTQDAGAKSGEAPSQLAGPISDSKDGGDKDE